MSQVVRETSFRLYDQGQCGVSSQFIGLAETVRAYVCRESSQPLTFVIYASNTVDVMAIDGSRWSRVSGGRPRCASSLHSRDCVK